MSDKVIVIGGGQAAVAFAAKYRALGGTAPIAILCDEQSLPYQRPPLSKKYLLGEMERERLFFRPRDWFLDNAIEVLKGQGAQSIDRTEKTVTLRDGAKLAYDKLLIATGSRARKLPEQICQNAKNIFTVRSLEDVDAMRPYFQSGRKLAVIGGGYIGLEAAAVARGLGVETTIIEASTRILGRVASPQTADYFRNLHQQNGAEILEGAALERFDFASGNVSGAVLSNGRTIAADFVIVGIGIFTNSEIAEAAGIDCDEGISVDAQSRTNDPHIYAAGDVTRFAYQGQNIRLESVQNAIDQAENAAKNILGQAEAYEPKPWFWSDQYDVSLQIAGLNLGYDDVVLRQSNDPKAQSVWYYRGDQLIAVDAMMEPRSYMIGKRVIEAGKTIPKDIVADPDQDLKPFMK